MSSFDYKNNEVIKWFKLLDKQELWPAKEVMTLFWYKNEEESFLDLLKKARNICEMKGVDPKKHFLWDMEDLNSLSLTKYSSFLISIFADLKKKEVTYAKMFFEIEIKNMYV